MRVLSWEPQAGRVAGAERASTARWTERHEALLCEHGSHGLAHSTRQAGLRRFEAEGLEGYLAWRSVAGIRVVLGDPVVAPGDRDALLGAFLASRCPTAFAQVGPATASVLARRGLRVTPLGQEAFVELERFGLEGRAARDLRHYRNRARRAGLALGEESDGPGLREELAALSRRWRAGRRVSWREMAFLVRPLEALPERGVRIFTARLGGALQGYLLLDPIWRRAEPRSYLVNHWRAAPGAVEGACDAALLHAIERLRGEGLARLSLGLCPLRPAPGGAEAWPGAPAWPLMGALGLLWRLAWPFNFRGLAFHKSRYRPIYEARFCAGRSRSGWEQAALWRACRVL